MTLVLITNEYTAGESLIKVASSYCAYECFIVERWKVHLSCCVLCASCLLHFWPFWSAILN